MKKVKKNFGPPSTYLAPGADTRSYATGYYKRTMLVKAAIMDCITNSLCYYLQRYFVKVKAGLIKNHLVRLSEFIYCLMIFPCLFDRTILSNTIFVLLPYCPLSSCPMLFGAPK